MLHEFHSLSQDFFLVLGVSDIPNCMNPRDFTCKLMRTMVKSGVYSDYVQNRIVQAQYYRDPSNEKGYLERNQFLPNLNNENDENDEYKQNLRSLDKFVMIRFSEDVMIKPGYTAVGGYFRYVFTVVLNGTELVVLVT